MRFSSGRYTGVVRYLRTPSGRQMTSSELLAVLMHRGHPVTPTGPIPKDFSCVDTIPDGMGGRRVTIHVRPASGRMGRRVFAECPECGIQVCAGHLHQHVEANHVAA